MARPAWLAQHAGDGRPGIGAGVSRKERGELGETTMAAPGTERVGQVLSVQVGRVAPLGPQGVPSGFVKTGVSGPVEVRRLGLEGDEQADLTVHGGPDKAVYCYPSEHYPAWIAEAARHQGELRPGGFGENLTTSGLDESSVAIGDVLAIGSAEVQVTQPRQPCFKLGLRFRDNAMGRAMLQSGRTGWYLRVLKEGRLGEGDAIRPVRRPNPSWTIERFNGLLRRRDAGEAELEELAGLEGLAEVWRRSFLEALGR